MNSSEFENEGRLIASKLGPGIKYEGRQQFGNIPFHLFTDDAVTGTTFVGLTLMDSQASLYMHRLNWKAPLPHFPELSNPKQLVDRLLDKIDEAMGIK